MKQVTRFTKMVIVVALLTSSLTYGAPLLDRGAAKAYCLKKGYCARTSDSRIIFVDPNYSDATRSPRFNAVDGEPIR